MPTNLFVEVFSRRTRKSVIARQGIRVNLVGGREYSTVDLFREAIFSSMSAFRKAANHLRQEQHALEDRTRRKPAGKTAEEPACVRRVSEPPEIRDEIKPIHVNMPRADKFMQSRAAMRATQAALLNPAPRC